VATATAVVLALEALVLGLVNLVMGLAVRHQSMSLAGLRPGAMAAGAWAAGALLALLLLAGAAVLALVGVRGTRPGRAGRALLLVCVLLHVVLAVLAAALVGWGAFVAVVVALGLLVHVLVGDDRAYGSPAGPDPAPDADPGAAGTV
jgi:hypothetical protein